tara:strand:- start:185 stop:625 length:441 start_codon:yes stop_codon:yes gene_type:complete
MEGPGWPTIDDMKFFKEQRKLARDRNPIGNAGLPLEIAPKSKSSTKSKSRSSSKKSKSKSKKSNSKSKSKSKKSKPKSPPKKPKTSKKTKRIIPRIALQRSQYWKDWYESLPQSKKNKLKRDTIKAKRRANMKRVRDGTLMDSIRL